jgi:hypothetical protein
MPDHYSKSEILNHKSGLKRIETILFFNNGAPLQTCLSDESEGRVRLSPGFHPGQTPDPPLVFSQPRQLSLALGRLPLLALG